MSQTPPEFPRDFVRDHCRKVAKARAWRRHFNQPPDPEDDESHAECAFIPAGCGMECTECRLFLTRPFCGHKVDEEWLPRIEAYYRDLAAWEASQDAERADQDVEHQALMQRGAGI